MQEFFRKPLHTGIVVYLLAIKRKKGYYCHMHELLEESIQAAVPRMLERPHLLHMSTGADSLACWLRMREWGMDVTPVYMYYMEGLPYIERYLEYLETFFGCRIYRLPSPLGWDDLGNGLYQVPGVGAKLHAWIDGLGWSAYTTDVYNRVLADVCPDKMHALGLRVSDGINRAAALKKYGAVRDKKWFPIGSFFISDVVALIKKHNLKLSPDYELFGMSFESPRYWMMPLIKKNLPKTFARIKQQYPLVNLLIGQNEAINVSRPPKRKNQRIAIYADCIIDWRGWE